MSSRLIMLQCLLVLADTRIITGMAILISGYYTMSNGLAAHYWSMVVYLAWFSCLTHLSVLIFLRNYLYHHPASRSWRLAMMLILMILLMIAIFPTGYFAMDLFDRTYFDPDFVINLTCEKYHEDNLRKVLDLGYQKVGFCDGNLFPSTNSSIPTLVLPSTPAACFFKGGIQFNGPEPVSMLISMLLLKYGSLVRACKVFKTISNKLSKTFQQDLDRIYIYLIGRIDRHSSRLQPTLKFWILSIILPFISGVYCFLRLLLDLYSSMARR